ncbi:MAG: electron transport complex subunit RsxC [Thermoplasmatota archaeon]
MIITTNEGHIHHFKEEGGFEIDISMKKESIDDPFTEVPPAERMIVFLRQHIGKETEPLVKVGDSVKYGQKIGDLESGGPMVVPVHSPVNGTVKDIRKLKHPISQKLENAVIINTENEEKDPFYEPMCYKGTPKEKLLNRVREAGIVGLGGASFPSHLKLSEDKKISHLIINAKESDPNLACDVRLMMEKGEDMIDGIKLMGKILKANNIIFATRTKEGEVLGFEKLLKKNGIEIARIRPNYSVGSERLLVKEVLDREVPSKDFPPSVGAVVHNVATAYAVAKAVLYGESLVSRGLTLYSKETGGENLWVRMGTPVEHVLKHCETTPEKFDRIAIGSIMMGPTIPNASYPVMKATSGITAFTHSEPSPYEKQKPCIRCGYCNTVCPVDIYPVLIMEAAKKDDSKMIKKYHAEDCIDCGLCSYVCPSYIKLTPHLRKASSIANMD